MEPQSLRVTQKRAGAQARGLENNENMGEWAQLACLRSEVRAAAAACGILNVRGHAGEADSTPALGWTCLPYQPHGLEQATCCFQSLCVCP